MERLFKEAPMLFTECALDVQEECPISGEYTLPEYCPDVAAILKCFADPRIQTRQWSGDQLLLDGSAVVRVLYLDEHRRNIRTFEFVLPFSCAMRGDGRGDNAAVELDLTTKYLNCRALSPRRVEIRGAVLVAAYADRAVERNRISLADNSRLCARTKTLEATIPVGSYDKILSMNESLEFDHLLPPAEMLLGGECRAVIHECKLLSGKAIIKGDVLIHQLYQDNTAEESPHCLDYTLPFSQIVDAEGVREGMPYKAFVHVLSDTERCSVGPDGEKTMLDVAIKLLIQIMVYATEECTILQDVYHTKYPISIEKQEFETKSLLGTRREITTLTIRLPLSADKWSEIVDVVVQLQTAVADCREGGADVNGKMIICVVAKDADGEIVCDEFTEDYKLSYPCEGNKMQVKPTVMDTQYRVIDDRLELQIKLCFSILEYRCDKVRGVSDLRLDRERPYPQQRVTTVFYYAESGESVWEIGRTCHVSPQCILDENGLCDDCLGENTVIVVPVFH